MSVPRAPRRGPALRLRSFAKVNLGLEVLGLREDGYHELRTLFQTIALHDEIVLQPRPKGVVVSCDHPGVPQDAGNLAVRAAQALQRWAGIEAGVSIAIHKRIPVAGGLGGGSSNAAAVLLGLDRLWRLELGPAGLHRFACRLGADVPFFLVGGTALGVGRGEEVYPLLRQFRAHVVVVDMRRPLSTAAVFRRLDASLTPRENSPTIFRFVSRDLDGWSGATGLANDLEAAALQEAPDLGADVARVRATLNRAGARLAALSGSGSSYFGVFEEAATARRAQAALEEAGYSALRSRTLTFTEYRRSLVAAWPGRSSAGAPRAGKERTTWRSRTSRSSRLTTRS